MSTVLPFTLSPIPEPIPDGTPVKLKQSIYGEYSGQNNDVYGYTAPKDTIVRIHKSTLTRRVLVEGQDQLAHDYKFSLDMVNCKYHPVEPIGISVSSSLIPHTKLAILPTSPTNIREMRTDRFWKIKDVAYVREKHTAPVGKQNETGWVTVDVGDSIVITSPPKSRRGSDRVPDYQSAFYMFGVGRVVDIVETPIWYSIYDYGPHVFERV